MDLVKLPIRIYNIGVHTYNATQHVRLHLKEKQAFYEALPSFLDRQVQVGNLQRNPSPQQHASTEEWIMTIQGSQAIFQLYQDVYPTLQSSADLTPDLRGITSLQVRVDSSKAGSAKSLQHKIGTRWRPQIRDRLLRDKKLNPFLSVSRVKYLGRHRMAMGLLRKSIRSDGFGDLILVRALGLAQLCGIEALNFADIHEILTHAHFFEMLYRAYLALLVGNIDPTSIANLGFGPIFENQPLGSTPLDEATVLSFANTDRLAEIGSVHQSKVALSSSLENLQSILEFCIPRAAAVKEGETVHIHHGWANCLKIRARIQDRLLDESVQYDMHRSPLCGGLSPAPPSFKLKRIDGRLVALAPMYGFLKFPNGAGKGLFGRPCGCNSPSAARTIHAAKKAVVNGVEVSNASQIPMGRLMYHNVYLLWTGPDIADKIWETNSYHHSTGCSFLVAGGYVVF